jgi:ketosteroid isomerase-like protein
VNEGVDPPRGEDLGVPAGASDPVVTRLGPSEVLTAVNRAWRGGRLEELRSFFHPDVVVVGPDLTPVGSGRDACVESYAQFLAAATVHEFEETQVRLDEYGQAAVVSYDYRIRYDVNDVGYDERGREVIILVRQGETWQVAWRLVLPPPS